MACIILKSYRDLSLRVIPNSRENYLNAINTLSTLRLTEQLSDASYNGFEVQVRKIIEDAKRNGIRINMESALINASTSGYLDIIKYLVENGANINAGNYLGEALVLAAENGHLDVVKYLVENGIDT